jgi:hypothetical protein
LTFADRLHVVALAAAFVGLTLSALSLLWIP